MYLRQFIREYQVAYPRISQTPLDVMIQLLFTNGNGFNISEDGNFIKTVYPNQRILFKDYYKNEVLTGLCIEMYDLDNMEEKVNRIFINKNNSQSILDQGKSENDMIRESLNQYRLRYDKVNFIDNYSLEDLKKIDTWYDMIEMEKPNIILSLNKNNHLSYFFTKDTEKNLLEVTIAVSKAIIKKMEELIISKAFGGKNIFFAGTHEEYTERLVSCCKEDIKILKKEIQRFEWYLNPPDY